LLLLLFINLGSIADNIVPLLLLFSLFCSFLFNKMQLVIKKTMGYQAGMPILTKHINIMTATIGDLKVQIAALTGINVRFQKLISMGHVLGPDDALCFRQLKCGATAIHLTPNGLDAMEAFHINRGHDEEVTTYGSILSIHFRALAGRSRVFQVPGSTSIREMKRRFRDVEGTPVEQSDFLYNGVCLREDHFAIADYAVPNGSTLDVVIRLHRNGLAWTTAHERRLARILGILEPFSQSIRQEQLPPSLYPLALERLSQQSDGCPDVIFAALSKTLPFFVNGSNRTHVTTNNAGPCIQKTFD